jgi:hypothetical protein
MRVSQAPAVQVSHRSQRLVYVRSSVDGSLLRTASLNGTSYLVVPCVSKLGDNVEWPVNAPYPELVPAEVLSLAAHMRNNRPVVMGHPQDVTGEYISANTPEILAKYAFGHVFNARFDSGSNKILCDLWLDPAKAQSVGPDAESVITRLQAGQMVEVSEGDYVAVDETPGVWIDGRKYGAKWVLCFPDHVAALREDEIGACSIEDGCGALRASQGFGAIPALRVATGIRISALSQARRPSYTGTETSTWSRPSFADYIRYLYNGDSAPASVSQCSTELKRSIAAHTLLGDPEASNFGDLSALPVVNPATSYLNENALRAVLAGRGLSGLSDSAVNSAQEMCRRLLNSEFSANLEAAAGSLKPNPNSFSDLDSEVYRMSTKSKPNLFKRLFASISALPQTIRDAMSNNELRSKLYEAISKVEPGLYYVEDEDPDTRTVVYMTRVIYDTYDYRAESFWWQRTYEMDSAGNVTLNDDRQAVEPAMVWKPAEAEAQTETPGMNTAVAGNPGCGCQNTGGEIVTVTVNRSAVVARLSALPEFASRTESLNSMSDQTLADLDKAFPVVVSPAAPVPVVGETQTPSPNPALTPVAPAEPANAASSSGSVSISREEHAELQAYRAAQAERKSALVTSLAASQAAFSAHDLQAMDLGQLEKLAQLPGVGINAAIGVGTSTFVVPPVAGSVFGQRVSRKLLDSWGLEAAKNKTGTGAAN